MDTGKLTGFATRGSVQQHARKAPARPGDGYPEKHKLRREEADCEFTAPALSLCGEHVPFPAPALGARRAANSWSRPDRKEPIASAGVPGRVAARNHRPRGLVLNFGVRCNILI